MGRETDMLAERIREQRGLDPRVADKKMFGGVGFTVGGNLFVGVTSKGLLLARYAKGADEEAKRLPGADLVAFDTPRRGGFLQVPQDALEDDDALKAWVDFCFAYAETLPPK